MKKILQLLGILFIILIVSLFVFWLRFDEPIVYTAEKTKTKISISTKYDDKEKTEFLKKVLQSMSIDFEIENKDDEVWVTWVPKSDEIDKEIHARVDQYGFVLRVCPQLSLPKPSDKIKEKLSCTSQY